MKKIIFTLLIFCGIGAGGYTLYKNYKGALPAILPPADSIGKMLEQAESIKENTVKHNQELENELGITITATTTEYYQQGPLTLPKGFSISVFAENLDTPRVITHAPNGGLLISEPKLGRVVKIQDQDGDGKAELKKIVVSGLQEPHGLLVKCTSETECDLYIAETNQVGLYDYDFVTDTASNKRKIIDLPSGDGHWTRTIIETPLDGKDTTELLVSVGSSCNVCEETDERRAKILIANLDGTNVREYATGLRNAVFMAIHPVDGNIWVTENSRDRLGDDLPPDEINIIKSGADYGWPICYGKNLHDSNFDKNQYIQDPCVGKQSPHIEIQAHSAPLGLAFIPEEGYPEHMWYNLLVAYHGSWNRTEPTGYKIVRYRLDAQGNTLGQEDFISGWLSSDGVLGRPVDILVESGGTMYISDDKAGVVYRVVHQNQN